RMAAGLERPEDVGVVVVAHGHAGKRRIALVRARVEHAVADVRDERELARVDVRDDPCVLRFLRPRVGNVADDAEVEAPGARVRRLGPRRAPAHAGLNERQCGERAERARKERPAAGRNLVHDGPPLVERARLPERGGSPLPPEMGSTKGCPWISATAASGSGTRLPCGTAPRRSRSRRIPFRQAAAGASSCNANGRREPWGRAFSPRSCSPLLASQERGLRRDGSTSAPATTGPPAFVSSAVASRTVRISSVKTTSRPQSGLLPSIVRVSLSIRVTRKLRVWPLSFSMRMEVPTCRYSSGTFSIRSVMTSDSSLGPKMRLPSIGTSMTSPAHLPSSCLCTKGARISLWPCT